MSRFSSSGSSTAADNNKEEDERSGKEENDDSNKNVENRANNKNNGDPGRPRRTKMPIPSSRRRRLATDPSAPGEADENDDERGNLKSEKEGDDRPQAQDDQKQQRRSTISGSGHNASSEANEDKSSRRVSWGPSPAALLRMVRRGGGEGAAGTEGEPTARRRLSWGSQRQRPPRRRRATVGAPVGLVTGSHTEESETAADDGSGGAGRNQRSSRRATFSFGTPTSFAPLSQKGKALEDVDVKQQPAWQCITYNRFADRFEETEYNPSTPDPW